MDYLLILYGDVTVDTLCKYRILSEQRASKPFALNCFRLMFSVQGQAPLDLLDFHLTQKCTGHKPNESYSCDK